MVPCERFHSRSLDLPVFAVSLRAEGGMVVRVTPAGRPLGRGSVVGTLITKWKLNDN